MSNTTRRKRGNNKNKNKTANFKNVKCSPNKTRKNTCYSDKNIFILKKYWNKHNKNQIKSNNPSEIWKILKNKFKHDCNKESCWLKNSPLPRKDKIKILNESFAPLAPKEWKQHPNTWLSSLDLLRVLKQYEHKYPNFTFIGPSPIDYDHKTSYQQCVWNDLCKFSLNNLMYRNKNFIGVIFNTDPHNLGGSHWISMVIDCNLKHILFFDSVGRKMPKQVNKFIQNVVKQGKERNIEFKVDELHNHNIEHQEQDTECGMYSLYFIINMLTKKKNWNYFTTTIIPDKDVEKFRNIYFNKNL